MVSAKQRLSESTITVAVCIKAIYFATLESLSSLKFASQYLKVICQF